MDYRRIEESLLDFFVDIPASCPYGLPYEAVYRQSMLGRLPEPLLDILLEAGFRRNGNTIYTMGCRECSACVPIRLDVRRLNLSRAQRRSYVKNQDLRVETGPVEITNEKLAVLDRFLQGRYRGRDSTAADYYGGFFANSITDTAEVRYFAGEKLVGTAIVDIGCDCMSAVYFYFDPEMSRRSPGIFNILTLAQMCERAGGHYLYLGYMIKEVQAMAYKGQFRPHELLLDGEWVVAQ